MIGLRWGIVNAISDRHDGLVRFEVDGVPCVAYTRLTGEVEEGDTVLVNGRARELELGSGGFDVLAVNLTRGLRLPVDEDAHVVAWPYAPGQHVVRFAEEDAAEPPPSLGNRPVVCCGLHSQVAPVCAALTGLRVAYVQVAGGALPVSLSDTLRTLRARQLVEVTIAVSPCVDADLQCVTLASALMTASARGVDAIVVSIGPGVVGTASTYGHGGLVVADAVNATAALGGHAIVAPRVSHADERERHRGLSHHTRSALSLCLGDRVVAWPSGLDTPDGVDVQVFDAEHWREACANLPLSHMGRGPDDDPWFFATAFAAGVAARASR